MTEHRPGPRSARRRAVSLACAAATLLAMVFGAGAPANAQAAAETATSSMIATEGACHVTVIFSQPVVSADAARHGSYALHRRPLTETMADIDVGEGDTTLRAVILLGATDGYDTASVPAGCAPAVRVRDRWAVRQNAIRAADGSGLVGGAEVIVYADNAGPGLTALAPPGGNTVWIRSDEPLAAGTVTVTLSRPGGVLAQTAQVGRGDTGFEVAFNFPPFTSYKAAEVPFTQPPWLYAGDKIAIAANQVGDRAGNGNPALAYTVAADSDPPSVSAARLHAATAPAEGTAAVDIAVRWSEPVQGCGVGPSRKGIDLGQLRVDVDGDGFVDYALDGFGAAWAGVAFARAHDASQWSVPGTAACDQSWWESQGTLVARLVADSRSAAMLPRAGSVLRVGRGAAHDLVGNPSRPHAIAFTVSELPVR